MSRTWDSPPPATPAEAAAEVEAGRELVAAAQRRRRSTATSDEHTPDDSAPARSALDGVPAGMASRVTPWRIAAGVAAALSIWLVIAAMGTAPQARPVTGLAVSWLDGPRIPDSAVLAMINRFPDAARLNQPNDWVLDRLAAHLRTQPGIAEVRQIRLVHTRGPVQAVMRAKGKPPATVTVPGINRKLEIQLGMRQPFLPGVLRDGTRVWIDREGMVLPGIIPGPGPGRPVVRSIEEGGTAGLKQAAALWALLADQVERGLITDLLLAEPFDPPTTGMPVPPRGLVAVIRGGGRILIGRPDEERLGITLADKTRNLVHTLRCQGDPARLALLNVRFHEPTYTLRQTTPGAPAPAVPR